MGAEKQFENIIGIRCEADFEQVYFGEKTFENIHSLLLEYKYFLLNIDYFGRGQPQSYFSWGGGMELFQEQMHVI